LIISPPAFVLGATRERNVHLNPGEIRKGKIKFKVVKIGFNELFQKFTVGLQTPSTTNFMRKLELGFSELYGFETQLNDRSSPEAKISLCWELNQSYCVRVFGKKPVGLPFIEVT